MPLKRLELRKISNVPVPEGVQEFGKSRGGRVPVKPTLLLAMPKKKVLKVVIGANSCGGSVPDRLFLRNRSAKSAFEVRRFDGKRPSGIVPVSWLPEVSHPKDTKRASFSGWKRSGGMVPVSELSLS